MTVPTTHLNNSEHMLIPVTAKMIHSTVHKCERFVLRDCCLLCMVKLVGAVMNYHEYMKNILINVEDGTGLVRIIVWRKGNECKAALALTHECNSYGCIHVIGEVTDYYDVKEIIAFGVCPVSSGN
jgi:hypothetical protein